MNKKELIENFQIKGEVISCSPYGEGHINSTFLVETTSDKYILQRINDSIFKNVDDLMNNFEVVISFIKSKGSETIDLIPTKEGKLYYKSDKGYFRLMKFAENTICYQEPKNLDLVRAEGEAYGNFHLLVDDLAPTKIVEILPDFHNTEKRYHDFLDATKKADKAKLEKAKKEIELINKYKDNYSLIYNEIKKGNINTKITHNDTKINNILFDKITGKYRLIIDLDTIMPGSYLFDFGDALRSLFTGNNEDSEDLSKLKVDFDIYTNFAKGYLNKMAKVLTEKEIELLPFSAYLLTIECGIRFLEDYLRGDIYFHVSKPEHNLIRAKTQLTLAKNIYDNLDKLNGITNSLISAKE